MKKYLLLTFMIVSGFVFGQFTINQEEGLTDFVITNVPEKKQSEIYSKSKEWIERTFKNPDFVTKGDIVNDYIRFETVDKNYFCQNDKNQLLFNCYTVKSVVELSFKDGRYKFDVLSTSMLVPRFGGGVEYMEIDFKDKTYYKKDKSVRSSVEKLFRLVPKYYNSMNGDLSNYIAKGIEKNDNW
ncbi:hypothetical protein [Soonwooa sp.]|uniref:hypothetical protein n=1 Tax=Soonwooa sp. TaxID=1938592 RepID=UPI0028A9986F|nr:hypothetical protein [Soonwooa sp.]